jgi:hypothetical protein
MTLQHRAQSPEPVEIDHVRLVSADRAAKLFRISGRQCLVTRIKWFLQSAWGASTAKAHVLRNWPLGPREQEMSKFQSPMLAEELEHRQEIQAGVVAVPARSRKAFISAPACVDTSVLRRALEERGITPFELDEVRVEGRSVPQLLEDCLRSAELVVAVVSGGKAKENVLFELGYALALKKRILAIVPPQEEPPLSEIPCLRARPDNKEAIEFGLDQILTAPEPRRNTRKKGAQKTKPLGPLADKLLDQIRDRKQPLGDDDLEQLVREVLHGSGIDSSFYASESNSPTSAGADVAVWSDDFEPWLGNPLLIELKSDPRSRVELIGALNDLARTLDNTHTAWGLLIYQGADFEPTEEAPADSRVFVLNLERLIESLRNTSLGDFLHRMRNSRVHGRG